MRRADRLAGAVQAAWWGDGSPLARAALAALTPASWIFGGAVWARNRWYDRAGGRQAPIPVVSVGNLTVGGAGKTPLLRTLWEGFRDRHVRPALVTRGYGDDEVALYREWFGGECVFVSPARVAGVHVASRAGYDVALVDDGFQHRALDRSVDVLLVASDSPFPPRLLPRGPYREPLSSARRASVILVVGRSPWADTGPWASRLGAAAPGVPVGVVRLGPAGWATLDGSPADAPRGPLFAVASTANPAGFSRLLEDLFPGVDVELRAYPDHHGYGGDDISDLESLARNRTLVTTEKDAVKLRKLPHGLHGALVLRYGVVGNLPACLLDALGSLAGTGAAW